MNPVKVVSAISTREENLTRDNRFTRQLRRADLFIKLAVSAAYDAIECSGTDINPLETGLFLGTSFGPMQTNFEVLDLIVEEQHTSPTLFSHSVFNAAAGYIARVCDIRGNAGTVTDFCWPFFQALQLGCTALTLGQISSCLVLQVETYSHLLLDARDARKRSGSVKPTPWPAGAVAWLLTQEEMPSNSPVSQIKHLDIDLRPSYSANSCLHEQPLLHYSGREKICPHPLSPAEMITNLLKQSHEHPGTSTLYTLTSPWGKIDLHIDKTTSSHAQA